MTLKDVLTLQGGILPYIGGGKREEEGGGGGAIV